MEDKLYKFANNNKEKVFVLLGPPGSGKTTLISKVFSSSKINKKFNVRFTAPTQKASNILANKIEEFTKNRKLEEKYVITTIDKLLGYKISRDICGNAIFIFKDKSFSSAFGDSKILKMGNILIIDECSMIDTKTYDDILRFSDVTACKIVFAGDPLQLPPSDGIESPIFKHYILNNKYEILRNNYRSIYPEMADDFRKYVKSENNNPLNKYFDKNKKIDIIKEYISDENQSKIIICDSVSEVKNINNLIRNKIWENEKAKEKEKFYIGEKLITTRTFTLEKNIIHSGTEIIIDTVDELETKNNKIPYYLINGLFTVIFESYLNIYDSVLKDTKKIIEEKFTGDIKTKAYEKYYDMVYFHNPITYGYCINVEQSQGSEYDSVYVNISDILKSTSNSEIKRKKMYTAISRHVKKCTLF